MRLRLEKAELRSERGLPIGQDEGYGACDAADTAALVK